MDDRLGDTHFLIVEFQQRAIFIDAADANDPEVDLELVDEVDGCLADDAAIAGTHHAAGHDDIEILLVLEDGRHVQVVGDDLKPVVITQRLGHHLVAGADVDEQRGVVRNLPGQGGRHAPLGAQVQCLAGAVGGADGTGLKPRAPVHALERAGLGQLIEVATNGLRRDLEVTGQLLDGGISLTRDQFDNGAMALWLHHPALLLSAACET